MCITTHAQCPHQTIKCSREDVCVCVCVCFSPRHSTQRQFCRLRTKAHQSLRMRAHKFCRGNCGLHFVCWVVVIGNLATIPTVLQWQFSHLELRLSAEYHNIYIIQYPCNTHAAGTRKKGQEHIRMDVEETWISHSSLHQFNYLLLMQGSRNSNGQSIYSWQLWL